MVQQLMSREVELIDNQARRPAEQPLDFSFIPKVKIPETLVIKDYTMLRVEPPRGSPMGEHAHGVSSGKTETERPIITYRYTYTLNKTEFRMAAKNGYDIIGKNSMMMRSAMEHNIMALILQGTGATTTTDLPDISGMLDVGEDVDAGLTAGHKWATATKPVVHIKAGFDDLQTNLYYGPFSLILSRNLESSMYDLNNAANPRTHEEIIRNGFVKGGIYYFSNGASAYGAGGYTINPLPAATTTDGVWIMFAPKNGDGEDNFYLAEVSNGIETTVPGELDENNNYTISMEWRGGPVFRNATTATAGSAEYIVYEPDVDLAT